MPENILLTLLNNKAASAKDLADAVNGYNREMTTIPLVSVHSCNFCGSDLILLAPDLARALAQKTRICCWSKTCRTRLLSERNSRARQKKKNSSGQQEETI